MLCSNDALHGINSQYNFDQRFLYNPMYLLLVNIMTLQMYCNYINVYPFFIPVYCIRIMIEIERDTNIRALTKR